LQQAAESEKENNFMTFLQVCEKGKTENTNQPVLRGMINPSKFPGKEEFYSKCHVTSNKAPHS
jgi:hypothetical protein